MLHFRLAVDAILCQMKKFVMSALLIAVNLVVIIFLLLLYRTLTQGYNSLDGILRYGMKQTGVLQLDAQRYESADMRGFLDEAITLDEIACIGEMCIRSTPNLPELYEIQKDTKGEFFAASEGYLRILNIDVHCINLCELDLADGMIPSELDFSADTEEHSISYLYLGSDFEAIPVGTEYTTEYATYIVAGIMKDNQRWLNPNSHFEFGSYIWDYSMDCSNAVFAVNNMINTTNMWISAAEGYTIEQAMDAADALLDKYHLSMLRTSLTDRYENSCADTILLVSYFGKAFGIVIPAVILMLVTMQIVSVLLELKNYGVMYATGFSVKDISLVLIIKNVIMAIVAFMFAAPVTVWLEGQWFYKDVQYIIKNIMLTHALPYAILILLVVTIITSATAVGTLRRYTPVELMRKQN